MARDAGAVESRKREEPRFAAGRTQPIFCEIDMNAACDCLRRMSRKLDAVPDSLSALALPDQCRLV